MLNLNFYKNIVEQLHDGLYFVDVNRVITYWNKAAEKITGFSAEEVIGKSCKDNILTHVDKNGINLCQSHCPLADSIKNQKPHEAEVYLHHKDGHRVPVSVRVNPMKDENNNIIGGFEIFSDLTNEEANKLRLEKLEKLSYIDHLTQMSNRPYIEEKIQNALNDYHRHNISFGILFIDIDYFKAFNDTYGHNAGDMVLQFVANTFSSNCRPFDIYGRWGGEEFVGLIQNIEKEQLIILGNRMRELVDNSYLMHDKEKLSVTVSIGATIVQENDELKTIIARADEQLYLSKKNGRNRLSIN